MIPPILRHAVVVYTLPAFVSRAIGLVLLPLYTTCLTMDEFGQYELLLTAQMFLTLALGLGWESAYVRLGAGGEVAMQPLARSLLVLRWGVWALAAAAIAVIQPDRLALWVTGDAANARPLVLVTALWVLQDLRALFAAYFRIQHRAGWFAGMHIALSVMQLGVIAWLMLGLGWKLEGIFGGMVIAFAAVLAVMLAMHGRALYGHWAVRLLDPAIFKRALKLGLPLAPAAVAVFLVTAGDRWMLLWLSQPADAAERDVAVYGLAFKFVALVQLCASGFQSFFSPYVYRHYRKRNAARRMIALFGQYNFALALAVLALAGASSWIVWLVFPDYVAAIPLAPLALGAFFVYAVGDFFCIGITIRERTGIRARAGIATALANVGLNFLLIPTLGPVGAATATTASYVLYAWWLMRSSNHLYPVAYPYLRWLGPVAWTLGGFGIASTWPAWLPAYAGLGLVGVWITRPRNTPVAGA